MQYGTVDVTTQTTLIFKTVPIVGLYWYYYFYKSTEPINFLVLSSFYITIS